MTLERGPPEVKLTEKAVELSAELSGKNRAGYPQVIAMNGRLVGTRTRDLHRVNSPTREAQPSKAEQQTAPKG
jgi:histidinol phosphatase-like enzyme